TSSVPVHARVEAQGTGDLTLSLCGAIAALGSGFVKQSFEYHILADLATVLAGGMLLYALYVRAASIAASSIAH
ncbi:MAG: hypothetical protein CL412_07890, partial [Acidimicrobiaceae bacterium]|nr:hypothetical protein [Acidimicrobiaceae bacterium]MEC7456594.1 hypothetical protein [Actinomycetota bacterium]